ncbi:hypothetical protein H5410_032497 [Solanum commersonii]|uniref:Terpene synthase metal-binding domain-containing protein n=1 Tax=Solanum commersonii TaxID=4109 RepID=A0A9J5YN15_SOLCO|nr:hypothetical protein H5410_032497 [Solanum commersonii]
MMGLCFEPQCSQLRRMLTKVVYMNSIVDDTYGTHDELNFSISTVKQKVLAKEDKSNNWKKLGAAYMKESDWLNAGYIPKCDEYMKIAVLTAPCVFYVTNSFVGMDKLYLTNGFLVARSAGVICRCMVDISDHEVSITQHVYNIF